MIDGRPYDTDALAKEFKKEDAELIVSHYSNRKPKTQDDVCGAMSAARASWRGPFPWLQCKCRLLIQWQSYAANFLGSVQLAFIIISPKQFKVGSSLSNRHFVWSDVDLRWLIPPDARVDWVFPDERLVVYVREP